MTLLITVSILLVSLVGIFLIVRWFCRELRRQWMKFVHSVRERRKDIQRKAREKILNSRKGKKTVTISGRLGFSGVSLVFVGEIVFTFLTASLILSALGLELETAIFAFPAALLGGL